MKVAVSIIGIAFAAFCVWLLVRIVNRRERWAILVMLAVVPFAGYVGAYAYLVEPIYFHSPPGSVLPLYDKEITWFGRTVFKTDHWQSVFEGVFAPIHWIDRRVRPGTWMMR